MVIFSIPIYLLLFRFKNPPITTILPHTLSHISLHRLFPSIITIPFISPILSSIINNIPTLLIHPIPIPHSPVSHSLK
ncbi:ArsB/NhaD family transporter, partial [Staphylococcus warneri]|uniref:ArsB/NhaD family transporter n=1 Tax=Staphylococcus warneri TaxID=1292 RepID=UPI003F7B0573